MDASTQSLAKSAANCDGSSVQELRQRFYDRARIENLAPLWAVLAGLVGKQPSSPAVPAHWPYDKVRSYLLEAAQLIGTAEAERRVLMLENPALPGESKITRSLYAGLQIILPGERAHAHRHVAAALRFVIEGTGAWTTVNGERTQMNPGDFVVTPSWTWHEHGNDGDGPVVWMDGLDVHLVNMFDAGFREDNAEMPPIPERPVDSSTWEYGLNMLPMDADQTRKTSPIFNYPFVRSREALEGIVKYRAIDPCHGHKLRYINPLNGDWAISSIATWMQMLPAGFASAPYRSTDGTIHVVVEGKGHSMINDVRIDWAPQDVFVVPSWAQVTHHPDQDAVFFGASDRAVQEKIGLWRELRG